MSTTVILKVVGVASFPALSFALHVTMFSPKANVDPEAAGKIHPNDSRRIIRALEIYNSTGKTMTELKSQTKGLKDIYDIKIFGLTRAREDIYSAIDSRIDKMFKEGIVPVISNLF